MSVQSSYNLAKSEGSFAEGTCRICLQNDDIRQLIVPCDCRGSALYAHFDCLSLWIKCRNAEKCNVCQTNYSGVEIKKIPNGFVTFLKNDPEMFGAILLWTVMTIFLFYILYLGSIDYVVSQKIIPDVYRNAILIPTVAFGTFFVGFIFFLLNDLRKHYKVWQEGNYVLHVKEIKNKDAPNAV